MSGGHNIKLLAEQIRQFRPRKASVATKELAEQLSLEIPSDVKVYYGEEGLIEIAAGTDAEFVVTAVVGSQGLAPTIAAIEAGNKSDWPIKKPWSVPVIS